MKELTLQEHPTFVGSNRIPYVVATCAALAFATQVGAQQDEQVVEEVIVIGTPGGAGIDRQEASFAVTTIEPEDIERISPQSTADLVKSIPGIWVESSGGIAGANIDVRGLPGGGDETG